jgi:hypothetical protein
VVGLLWFVVAGLGFLTIVSAAMRTFKWNCDRPTPLPSQGPFGPDPGDVARQNAERCQSFLGGLEVTVYVALGASGALLLAYGLFRHFRDKLTHRADMLREDSD